ncbi:MAG: hypothetical protein MJZ57_00340 [Bacteroidales bacterium]|nr:hypothetical protein [Bacteroidales bacterium]
MNITESEFKWMVELMTADLIRLLIEREDYEFARAFEVVYDSVTYRALIRPETGLYFQSPGYVFSYLQNEIKTGKME